MLAALELRLRRAVRRVIWPRPALYAPFGILRGRGNVFESSHRLYISGFPRSGNTFAVKAFLLANPGTTVCSHTHIPAFVVQSVKQNMPGMVLVRNPLDASISWAIYQNVSLLEALAYYIDYHKVLLPYRDRLFLVSFEDVTTDFGAVIGAFNVRWNADYHPFQQTPANVARCMAEIEADYMDHSGRIVERKVARPSNYREPMKEALLRKLNHSPKLQEELFQAAEVYRLLTPNGISVGESRKDSPLLGCDTAFAQK